MNQNDFVPASQLARMYGCKGLYYGPAGCGKTPLIMTAPRPLLVAVEPGLGSMRAAQHIPTANCINSIQKVDEFFAWLRGSTETRNYDTIGLDSGSYLAELILREELEKKTSGGNKADGKAAYGNMSRRVYKYLFELYALQQKHVYLIAKQGTATIDGVEMTVPYFPGKDLYSTVPGLYDIIGQIGSYMVPPHGVVKAIRTIGNMVTLARHRTGNLNEFEPCDLTALFNKAMT